MRHHACLQKDNTSTEWRAHAQWQHHQDKNETEKVSHTCQCQRGPKYETEQRRGRKDIGRTEEAKMQMFEKKNTAREPFIRNWRLTRKEKTSHQRLIFLTTVLRLKCRSLCTRIQLCWPQHLKGKTKNWENRRKAQTLGKRVRKEKQQYRTERVNLHRRGWEQQRRESLVWAAVLNLFEFQV